MITHKEKSHVSTPPQHPNQPGGNPFAAPGGYAPNAAPQPGYATPQPGYAAPQPGYAAPNPAPGQNPYAQDPAYGQNPYGAQNSAYGQPGQAPDPQYGQGPSIGCRTCGAQPAGDITIRQHTGLLIAMRFSKMEGPLCRNCATAIHRDMTTKTLAGGWWSPVSLVLFTPLTLLWNLYAHTKLKKLPHPMPSPTGIAVDQGKPVLHRPLAYLALIPVGWLVTLLAVGLTS
jgi:hypothetical protein